MLAYTYPLVSERYILDENNNPVEEPDLMKWAEWMEKSEWPLGRRIVAQENVGDYWVSTVFLGIDHRFMGEGPPILWETMAFKHGDMSGDERQERYTSLAAARHGHAMMCDWARITSRIGERPLR